jgi:hypothetical protein
LYQSWSHPLEIGVQELKIENGVKFLRDVCSFIFAYFQRGGIYLEDVITFIFRQNAKGQSLILDKDR